MLHECGQVLLVVLKKSMTSGQGKASYWWFRLLFYALLSCPSLFLGR